MRVSEIRVKRIRVNQGLGVYVKYLFIHSFELYGNATSFFYFIGFIGFQTRMILDLA